MVLQRDRVMWSELEQRRLEPDQRATAGMIRPAWWLQRVGGVRGKVKGVSPEQGWQVRRGRDVQRCRERDCEDTTVSTRRLRLNARMLEVKIE